MENREFGCNICRTTASKTNGTCWWCWRARICSSEISTWKTLKPFFCSSCLSYLFKVRAFIAGKSNINRSFVDKSWCLCRNNPVKFHAGPQLAHSNSFNERWGNYTSRCLSLSTCPVNVDVFPDTAALDPLGDNEWEVMGQARKKWFMHLQSGKQKHLQLNKDTGRTSHIWWKTSDIGKKKQVLLLMWKVPRS